MLLCIECEVVFAITGIELVVGDVEVACIERGLRQVEHVEHHLEHRCDPRIAHRVGPFQHPRKGIVGVRDGPDHGFAHLSQKCGE